MKLEQLQAFLVAGYTSQLETSVLATGPLSVFAYVRGYVSAVLKGKEILGVCWAFFLVG